jgi:hypothetical protein
MLYRFSLVTVGLMISITCSASSTDLKTASETYKLHKDFASVEIILRSVSKGMPRSDVEKLLGIPDYSPTSGQFYYSTNKTVFDKAQNRNVNVGLVIDYRDDTGKPTRILQKFWLEHIGE